MPDSRAIDPELLLAALPVEERAVVLGWLDRLTLAGDELDAWPDLRRAVELVAVLTVAARDGATSREAAFMSAADLLGLSGPAVLRRFYRVHERAARQFVTGGEDAA